MASFRFFNHYIPTPFVLLILVEAAIFYASVYTGAYLRFIDGPDPYALIQQSLGDLQPRALLLAVVVSISMLSMGLYQPQRREGMSGVMLRVGIGFVAASSVLALSFYLLPELHVGRGVLLIALFLSFFAIVIVRSLFMSTVDKNALKRRVLVYGAGRRAASINELRLNPDQLGVYIVGFVHIQGEHDVIDSHKVIRLKIPLADYVVEEQIDEIVVAVNDRDYPLDELLDCRLRGVDIIEPLQFFERETGRLRVDLLHPSWMIFASGFNYGSLRRVSERTFDVFASLLLLIVSAPIMLAAALAIWWENKGGPIFYNQIRVGLNSEPITLYKFRSMKVDAEDDGKARWAQQGDERVTRVGAFMRQYRIDELPQLFNILKGDMSLIGPRPERPEFVQGLSAAIPFYNERHRVKPGLTGWAQLNYPYGSSELDALEKLQYDLYYVKNHSLLLDFLILFQTAEVVLWSRGSR